MYKEVVDFMVTRKMGDCILLAEEIGWAALGSIHIFTASPGEVSGKNKLSLPCNHNILSMKLLALESAGQDFLLIACNDCQEFKRFVIQGWGIHILGKYGFVTHSPVQCMVPGEPGIVYVSDPHGSVQEFEYSLSEFKPINKSIDTQLQLSSMCYIPAPHTAFVCCFVKNYFDGQTTVRAISKATNKVLWTIKENVDVKAVLYVAEDDVIIACDVASRRLLVLSSRDGSYLKTVYCMVKNLDIINMRTLDFHGRKLVALYSKSNHQYSFEDYYIVKFTLNL